MSSFEVDVDSKPIALQYIGRTIFPPRPRFLIFGEGQTRFQFIADRNAIIIIIVCIATITDSFELIY